MLYGVEGDVLMKNSEEYSRRDFESLLENGVL